MVSIIALMHVKRHGSGEAWGALPPKFTLGPSKNNQLIIKIINIFIINTLYTLILFYSIYLLNTYLNQFLNNEKIVNVITKNITISAKPEYVIALPPRASLVSGLNLNMTPWNKNVSFLSYYSFAMKPCTYYTLQKINFWPKCAFKMYNLDLFL